MKLKNVIKALGLLLGVSLSVVSGSHADTMLRVTETHYDVNLRPDCVATRMNPTTFADAPANACVPKTTIGTFGPDRIVKTTYDVAGQITKLTQGYGTSEARDYAKYTYTLNGLKLYEVDARNYTTQYRYDNYGRLDRIYYPCPSTQNCASGTDYEQFTYDANGNKTIWRRRNGESVTYSYDNLNRRTHEGGSYIADMDTAYDLQGRIKYKHFSTGGLGVDYNYDALGQVTSTTDMNARTVWYGYNQASVRASIIYPDTLGFGIGVDSLNRLTALNYSGNRLLTQTYNNDGQRLSLARGVNAVGGSTAYTYDALGRMTSLTNTPGPSPYAIGWSFTGRSPANQITAWSATTTLYDYVESATSSVNKTYDGLNRDAAIAAVTAGYDAKGNITKDSTRTLTYDFYNRLTSVALNATPSTPFITLTYDPEGRLSSSTYGGAVTEFLYDGTNLIGEYNHVAGTGHTSDTMSARYIHGTGVDEPLVWYPGPVISSPRYFYANYQGSIVAWADAAGQVQDYYKYDPYGVPYNNITANQQWGGLRFRYTGQIVIKEAQLYYYKARIYDPNLGTFLQTDPIGGEDDLNLYAYVAGDPINGTDPSGTQIVVPYPTTTLILPPITAPTTGSNALAQAIDDAVNNRKVRYWVTYTRYNPNTDKTYSGRTSFYTEAWRMKYDTLMADDAQRAVNLRISAPDHRIKSHMGYKSGVVDKYSQVYQAIRGREQMLINFHGGALSQRGTSGNAIRAVDYGKFGNEIFRTSAISHFGDLPDNSPGE